MKTDTQKPLSRGIGGAPPSSDISSRAKAAFLEEAVPRTTCATCRGLSSRPGKRWCRRQQSLSPPLPGAGTAPAGSGSLGDGELSAAPDGCLGGLGTWGARDTPPGRAASQRVCPH